MDYAAASSRGPQLVFRPMPEPTLDDAIPVRQHRSEDRPDGGVTLFMPRFSGAFARRFILPLFARPEFRVQLDDLGSAVWRACDGRTSVGEIVAALQARTGGESAELRTRVHQFLRRLHREGSIAYVMKEKD